MGTSATVALKLDDGSYRYIAVHWDGMAYGVGKRLLNNYNTVAKIEELLALGELSALYESTECPAGHSFNTPVRGYCIAYYRDRGDPWRRCVAKHTRNVHDLFGNTSYTYVFENGKWYYTKASARHLQELTEFAVNA